MADDVVVKIGRIVFGFGTTGMFGPEVKVTTVGPIKLWGAEKVERYGLQRVDTEPYTGVRQTTGAR